MGYLYLLPMAMHTVFTKLSNGCDANIKKTLLFYKKSFLHILSINMSIFLCGTIDEGLNLMHANFHADCPASIGPRPPLPV